MVRRDVREVLTYECFFFAVPASDQAAGNGFQDVGAAGAYKSPIGRVFGEANW